MKSISKLAAEYQKMAFDDIFEDASWRHEGDLLAKFAGKLLYKATKLKNSDDAEKVQRAHKLILIASDILKNM